MASQRDIDRAVRAIDERGALLVYPVQNKPDPPSLWQVLHPKRQMHWAWDENADPRVAALWHLRQDLAKSRRVVYSKWSAGRATLFSKKLFAAMLGRLRTSFDLESSLARPSRDLLEILRDDSPQPTRALRERAGLEGRTQETAFTRAMRPLWERLLVVGAGEIEEGGFPSLAIGATDLLFEPLWTAAETPAREDGVYLDEVLAREPWIARAWKRFTSRLEPTDG